MVGQTEVLRRLVLLVAEAEEITVFFNKSKVLWQLQSIQERGRGVDRQARKPFQLDGLNSKYRNLRYNVRLDDTCLQQSNRPSGERGTGQLHW